MNKAGRQAREAAIKLDKNSLLLLLRQRRITIGGSARVPQDEIIQLESLTKKMLLLLRSEKKDGGYFCPYYYLLLSPNFVNGNIFDTLLESSFNRVFEISTLLRVFPLPPAVYNVLFYHRFHPLLGSFKLLVSEWRRRRRRVPIVVCCQTDTRFRFQ